MKTKKYKVEGEKKIEWILTFIRKYLRLEEGEHLVSSEQFAFLLIVPRKRFLVCSWLILLLKFYHIALFVSVCVCQPGLLSLSWPDNPEPKRVLRKWGKTGASLRQEPNVGMNETPWPVLHSFYVHITNQYSSRSWKTLVFVYYGCSLQNGTKFELQYLWFIIST